MGFSSGFEFGSGFWFVFGVGLRFRGRVRGSVRVTLMLRLRPGLNTPPLIVSVSVSVLESDRDEPWDV